MSDEIRALSGGSLPVLAAVLVHKQPGGESESKKSPDNPQPLAPRRQHVRCRANVAHMSQSRPDSGLGFQVKVLQTFSVVHSPLGSGSHRGEHF